MFKSILTRSPFNAPLRTGLAEVTRAPLRAVLVVLWIALVIPLLFR